MNKIKITLLLSLVITICGTAYATATFQGVLLNPVKSIKTHELIDYNGNNVLFPATQGKYQLVFFGYTSCPDICPTTLHKIKNVINALKNRNNISFYFITIDGDRDKPQQIKQFVDYFHPEITGLTGSIHNIKKVEKEFGILTRKFQGKSALAYKLEHSVFMYLLNRQGKLMLMYPGSTTTAQLADDLNLLLSRPHAQK